MNHSIAVTDEVMVQVDQKFGAISNWLVRVQSRETFLRWQTLRFVRDCRGKLAVSGN